MDHLQTRMQAKNKSTKLNCKGKTTDHNALKQAINFAKIISAIALVENVCLRREFH